MNFLNETNIFLQNITFFDKSANITKKMRFLKGWQQNINALIGISRDLRADGIQFLLTRNLNQDCLENTFAVLRNRGGNNELLTPFQFICSFKRSFFSKVHGGYNHGNCEPTANLQLPDVEMRLESPKKKDKVIDTFKTESDYKTVDFGSENAFYILHFKKIPAKT